MFQMLFHFDSWLYNLWRILKFWVFVFLFTYTVYVLIKIYSRTILFFFFFKSNLKWNKIVKKKEWIKNKQLLCWGNKRNSNTWKVNISHSKILKWFMNCFRGLKIKYIAMWCSYYYTTWWYTWWWWWCVL